MTRRAEILAAAAQVFREKGFRGTSIEDIAQRLGTDRASLYYYFAGRDEIFEVIVLDAAKANAQQAEAIQMSDRPAPMKLRELIENLLASYARHPYLYVYVQEDLRHLKAKNAALAGRDARDIPAL